MNEDIFNHLIEVEGEAANLLFEAQMEADDKISKVKRLTDEEYKKASDELRKELEMKFEAEKSLVDATMQKELDDYYVQLKDKKVNYDAFKKMIDDVFCLTKNIQDLPSKITRS